MNVRPARRGRLTAPGRAGCAAARGKTAVLACARRGDAVRTGTTEQGRSWRPPSRGGPSAQRLRAERRDDACAARGLFSDSRKSGNTRPHRWPHETRPAGALNGTRTPRIRGRASMPCAQAQVSTGGAGPRRARASRLPNHCGPRAAVTPRPRAGYFRICANPEIPGPTDGRTRPAPRGPSTGPGRPAYATARGKGRPVLGAPREHAVRTSATEHRRGRPPQSQGGPPAPRLRAARRGDAQTARGLFSDLRESGNTRPRRWPHDPLAEPARREARPRRRRRPRGLSGVGRHGRIVPCYRQRQPLTRSVR